MKALRTGALAIVALLVAAFAFAGTAAAKDKNKDRIPDRWEKRYHLSLKVDQAKHDQDRDGLDNRGEFRSGSNPRKDDSDDDGVEDGDENAGVISSFDGTTLTIDLFGGGSVTGTVDEDTEVKCGHECGHDGDDPVESAERHPGPGGGEGPEDESTESEHHGGHHGPGGGEGESDCSVDDLAVDVVVHEAELSLRDGTAHFDEIELAK
jgi:hypothetical protein